MLSHQDLHLDSSSSTSSHSSTVSSHSLSLQALLLVILARHRPSLPEVERMHSPLCEDTIRVRLNTLSDYTSTDYVPAVFLVDDSESSKCWLCMTSPLLS